MRRAQSKLSLVWNGWSPLRRAGPHGAAFSGRVGWGTRPALVVVDLVRAYTEPGGPFLLPDPAHALVSSSLVRQVAGLGGDVSPFVPPVVAAFLDTGARGI